LGDGRSAAACFCTAHPAGDGAKAASTREHDWRRGHRSIRMASAALAWSLEAQPKEANIRLHLRNATRNQNKPIND